MKRVMVYSVVLSVFILLFLTGCNNNLATKADFPYYESVDSIVEESDDIIFGMVINENRAKNININLDKNSKEEIYVTYTTFNIEILEVIKGDLKVGDVIEVKQLGDKYGIVNDDVKKVGYFKKNQESIFFLDSYNDINPRMPYSTLNPYQGHIEFENNKTKVSKENKLFINGQDKKDIINNLKNKVK